MTDPAPTSPIEIEYAPPERSLVRRLRRRAVPVLLLLTALSAYWWLPPAWFRAQVLYWQSRCADYEAPADAIVASQSRGKDGFAVRSGTVPKEWTRFYNLMSPPGLLSHGTAFLHMLRRPGGQRVMVAVDFFDRGYTGGLANRQLHVRVFKPGEGARLPTQVQDKVFLHPVADEYRVYAGKLDPHDPTHFTIRLDSGTDELVFDGWVREDSVTIQERRASTPPPPL
jgi:hypothetical protein